MYRRFSAYRLYPLPTRNTQKEVMISTQKHRAIVMVKGSWLLDDGRFPAQLLRRGHAVRSSVLSRLLNSSWAFRALMDCTCRSTALRCSGVIRSPRINGPSVFITSN